MLSELAPGDCDICLIGNQSVAVLKEYNICLHYETKHTAFSKFKGDARKNKTRELLAKLHRQQGTLTRPSTAQDSATRASFEITVLITRTGRSFLTGDFVKECLSIISLSRNTVTRLCDFAQLLVFIRGVHENMEITQELAGFETLRSTTKSEDLFAAVERVLHTNGLSWETLVGITTDGAPKVSQCGGKVAKYHCILHQEQLCARSVGTGDVVRDVIKIINCIRSKALSHRQFRALLEEVDSQYKDVLYHQEVRWLSHGKVLKRFFELRHVIAEFLTSKNSDTQPRHKKWFCDVAFMVDITDLLNTLNIQLQGKDQIITELFDHITAFRSKLQLLCRHLSGRAEDSGTGAAALAINVESFKAELLSALRVDLVDALKTEVRAVLESELASIKLDIRAARSELKEYRETVTTELSGLSVKVKNMEESLSTCTDDITHLQKEVSRLTTLTEMLQNKCDDSEGRLRRNNVRIIGVNNRRLRSAPQLSSRHYFSRLLS
uniref:Transposase n=1 Tax=Denticeps clupeoides TaxID=299321 RepID=A0AAY4DM40_9TELE